MFDPRNPASGYALIWPRQLFEEELQAVLATFPAASGGTRNALEALFVEAFRGPDPIEDLQNLPRPLPDPWTNGEGPDLPAAEFGIQILQNIGVLPDYQPRRYYRHRHGAARLEEATEPRQMGPETIEFQQDLGTLIAQLIEAGYIDRRAGDPCADGIGYQQQLENLNQLIKDHCGLSDQWPLSTDVLRPSEDLFTLIEVIHDLVARPRTRQWHRYDEHYWYSNFHEGAGQAVFRWKINALLRRHSIDLELADAGEDRGILVVRQDDPRQDIIRAAPTAAAVDNNQDRVQHAISLFRQRSATTDDKRRACRELIDVLESRRRTVLQQLTRKDSGDLFRIANEFAIRHHRDDQRYDYDPDFLDWIFWWYLATVELSNRLLARP